MSVQQIKKHFSKYFYMNYIWLCILLSIISKKAAFAKSSTLEMPCTHVIEHISQDGFGSNLDTLVAKSILCSTKC